MQIKDYYSILQVDPSATLPEIKKAYRLLAQQYHPDKSNNDPYASAQFADIKEAYETLTDPSKKEYYLQQRWYNQSIGKRKTQQTITPVNILKQALELERYVAGLDQFRMDKKGLQEYITDLLNDPVIEKLNTFNELPVNKEIVRLLLNCAKPLSLPQLQPVMAQLYKINAGPQTQEVLDRYNTDRKKKDTFMKLEVWIILAITISICLLIYLLN